jgi:hypothetical protein
MESFIRNRFRTLLGALEIPPFPLAEYSWAIQNHNIIQFLKGIPAERQYRLSFESLVTKPEAIMTEVAQFLGVAYHEALLKPYEGGRMADGPGDPNFHRYETIDPKLAESWRKVSLPAPLTSATAEVAAQLGYPLPPYPTKEEKLK